jgi:AP2-associated kinase
MAYQGAAAAPVFQSAAYAYQQTTQQPGLLQTGQIINVNGIIVTVERYLSQGSWQYISLRIAALPIMMSPGGFAHVYVVQSQTPISGTRQHVLKRMAVPDESMLREVKKEVDVMVRLLVLEDISLLKLHSNIYGLAESQKLLRGHPNIVNFIEASSQPMGNGAHEVFILMEFCPGGGIIDMMNRRLRERLTESEILTIFVNVCEVSP